MRRMLLVAALAICLPLLFAWPASAAIGVGDSSFAPNSPCPGNTTFLQTGVSAGQSYTVPFSGVITSWTFHDASPIVSGLKLKVGRQAGIGVAITGESAASLSRPPNNLNGTFTRIPVQAGDWIGIYASGTENCSLSTANMADTFRTIPGDQPPNFVPVGYSSASQFRFPVDAAVEHDADGDNYGDESQDFCNTDSATQGPCLSPGSLTFGSQPVNTMSPPQIVRLTNTATQYFAITAISVDGDFVIPLNRCSSGVIAPGSYCELTVAFQPTGAGARSGTLSVVDSVNGSPHTVALTGTGSSTGQLAATTCGGKPATITGTEGTDQLSGTSGADVIAALGGNDTVSGLKGNDVICGGPGKDTLKGGAGSDTLLGQAGKDALKGGGGRDLCKGGKGKDTAKCEVEKSI